MKKVTLTPTQIKEGMTVARDLYTQDGILLIPSNTQLTPTHIIKINVYNINMVSVFVQDSYSGPAVEADPIAKFEKEMRLIETQQEKDGSITNSREFKAFAAKYDDQVHQVEDQLNEIVHSKQVNVGPLYDLINDILTNTAASNNLFTYMCRMKSSDNVTYSHSMNVSMLSCILGKWMNLTPHATTELALAGLLHDIGKVRINQDILNKAGKLTEDEFNQVKQHTTLGYEIVAATNIPLGVKHAILMHHEKMNGAGYPLGLSWNRIHQYAKIVSIVDIYDAMTAERPYHRRFHPFHVIKMFEEECYGILDTEILYVFLERIAHNFMDDQIMLDNGNNAKIIFIHHRNPSRPIVQLESGKIVDLLNVPELGIKDFL